MNDTADKPLVCVCIPTFNSAVTIRETLESILSQTYDDLIVHISDNASTDETLKIVESIPDSRIHIHRHAKNIGAEGNFTNCIQLGLGKYTAIFHADDIYDPEMLAKQVDFLENNPEVGAVFTQATTVDENGAPIGVIGVPPETAGGTRLYDFQGLIKATLKHRNFLVCPSVMVRTHIYQDEIVQWRGDVFRSSADVDTWFRIASKHPIAVLGEQLMRYRISRAQFSNSIRGRTEQADFFLVMDHYLNRPDVASFITQKDRRYYRWLARHDRMVRAANLLMLGRIAETRDLLRGWLSLDMLHAAITTRRGFVVLLTGLFLHLTALLGAVGMARAMINALRRASWK